MTTIAMAAGMFPSALGMGDGGGFRSPMAIAVIGGLVVSTVLSLVFVPAVFTVLDDVGRLAWRLFSRFVGDADEPEAPAHPQPQPGDQDRARRPTFRWRPSSRAQQTDRARRRKALDRANIDVWESDVLTSGVQPGDHAKHADHSHARR